MKSAFYYYTDKLAKVRNIETKEMFWQHLDGNGDWQIGTGDMPVPLYNQTAREKRKSENTICIVEGEKDVDTLSKMKIVSTTLPNGSDSKWKAEYTPLFENRHVVILPDNDDCGKEYAERIAVELLPVATSIKILDLTKVWTQFKEKGDITDVVELENNNEMVIEKLKALKESTPEYTPFTSAPTPFEEANLPDFPVDCLPPVIADFVKVLSESTQTPLEMSGVLALGVLATCMQGKHLVKIKKDHSEQLSLFAVAVAAPGERKSPVLKNMTAPINDYESEMNKNIAPDIEKNKAEKRLIEKRIKFLEDRLVKKGFDKEIKTELDLKTKELAEFEELQYLRIFVNDVTPEKLIDLLDKQRWRQHTYKLPHNFSGRDEAAFVGKGKGVPARKNRAEGFGGLTLRSGV